MDPMRLRLLMMVVVDDFFRGNEFAKIVVHLSSEIEMTIVSMNFDLMPNVILDSVLNVCILHSYLMRVD